MAVHKLLGISISNNVISPWLPKDIILCVPKVTTVPHKYLAEGDPLLCGVKDHLLRTEAASCLSEGGVKVLGRVDLNGRAGLGEGAECGRCKKERAENQPQDTRLQSPVL